SSLRPECPGSIELPEWLDAEVIHVVGPGVARAAIDEARREESLPTELSELIFRALQAEAELLQGDDEKALEDALWVVRSLPTAEALLRARAAAIGARAAENLRKTDIAMNLYAAVMASDPGAIRRLGYTLPVTFMPMGSDPELEEAIDLLKGSPR